MRGDLKISGAHFGIARLLLNDRVFRRGEIVDRALGTRLAAMEPEGQLLVFEDASGARVSRKAP